MLFLIILSTLILQTRFSYAEQVSCDSAIHDANRELSLKNMGTIQDVKSLVTLLRDINRYTIPNNYVTRDMAIKQGWSGNPNDSLWAVWTLNKKYLLDEVHNGKLKPEGRWFAANLDAIRGYPSTKYLIYNPQSSARYVSTDGLKTLIELSPCRD